ncbi:MAG TPA: ABC transporter permease [Candidatus Limnocylindrales bacterium]
MSARRVAALLRRLVEELHRDRRSMALLFVAPVVLTGLMAYVLRGQVVTPVSAVVVNEAGQPGATIVGALERAMRTDGGTVIEAPDRAAAEADLRDGTASIAIVVPADFVARLAAGNEPSLTVITPGLEPTADSQQLISLQRAIATAITQALPDAGVHLPRLDSTTLYGIPDSDVVDHLAPVFLGFFAYFFVYILTGISFLRERIGGTLERLLATPVSRGEIVLGYSLGFGLFATIQVVVLLGWTLLNVQVPAIGPLAAFSVGLAVPVSGSPLLAFLVVMLLALGAVSLGILLSTFARTELQVIQFIPLVIVPQALLSGVLFPVSSMPDILQALARILPLTYATDGLRQVVIRGADLGYGALQVDVLVLAAFVAVFAVLAAATIRREVV